ncbi:hypothetical protein AMTR_s00055p00116620 [Amborella trichopoda]|uniref:Uncharacterized protein n=1 Tax=Amborella trichopoda TaxID=13333 RepID=U5DA00_AMBTC|nr:hypothetical protein AMTR_s00055p00116620 [Amborella trichopoda]
MPKACMWKKQAHHKTISFDNIPFDMSTIPDRVMRQFGTLKGIPVKPPKWDRREKVGLHPTNWTIELGRQIKDWKAREHHVVKAAVDKSGGVPTAEYMA